MTKLSLQFQICFGSLYGITVTPAPLLFAGYQRTVTASPHLSAQKQPESLNISHLCGIMIVR